MRYLREKRGNGVEWFRKGMPPLISLGAGGCWLFGIDGRPAPETEKQKKWKLKRQLEAEGLRNLIAKVKARSVEEAPSA